jgi:hypothetical protein
VVILKIAELMKYTAPQPGGFAGPGIMAGGMHGKIRELAIIPIPDAFTF